MLTQFTLASEPPPGLALLRLDSRSARYGTRYLTAARLPPRQELQYLRCICKEQGQVHPLLELVKDRQKLISCLRIHINQRWRQAVKHSHHKALKELERT